MLFRLKNCVLHIQMRQFVMFHTNNTAQLKIKTIYHWREPKYSNIINPNLNVHRLLHSENRNILPPLMFGYPKEWNIFKILQLYFIVNLSIDPEFRLQDFIIGSHQALIAISTALHMQNYEALNGIVKEKAIKILKHRVDRLTPRQRELLSTDDKCFLLFPYLIKLRRNKDNNDAVLQIATHGMIARDYSDADSFLKIYYVFERRYKNGVGSDWIVRLVNYTSFW